MKNQVLWSQPSGWQEKKDVFPTHPVIPKHGTAALLHKHIFIRIFALLCATML